MARIDIAMARSLKRDVLEGVRSRDIAESAANIKTTLSSWDNCMAESYCKWPVIAAMIVGGLIVFSVVWCIIRCACCGLSCCCGCFSCLKCCGNCCGCCDEPNKKHKHLDEPYFPPAFGPKQGYAPPAPMMAGGISASEPPKFATFETGPNGMAVEPKRLHDDALPPMPSWDSAAKKRISLEEEPGAVPLEQLDPNTGQKIPLMGGAGNISRSGSPSVGGMPAGAVSPYGQQQSGFMNSNNTTMVGGAMAGGAMMAGAGGRRANDPYMQDPSGSYNDQSSRGYAAGICGRGYPSPQDEPYNPSFPSNQYGQSVDRGYDNPYSPNPGQGLPQDRVVSPLHGGALGVGGGRSYGNNSPRPYANGRQFSNDSRPQVPAGPLSNPSYGGHDDGYGAPMRGNSPPILQNTSGYGYQESQRGNSPLQQTGFAPPQRQYTGGTTAPPSYISRAPTNQGYGGGERW